MAHGIIRGAQHNLIHGIKHGSLLFNSMAGVEQDVGSLKYVPANGDQWTTTLAAAGWTAGNPSALWLCQEASGNLADSINSYTLTAANTPVYSQAVAGWSRTAVGTNDTTDRFSSLNADLGSTHSTSYLVLAYVALTAAPAGARAIIRLGGGTGDADQRQVFATTTPVYSARGTGVVTVNGVSNPGTTVHPVVLLFNRSTTEFTVMTDQEKITTTWVNPTSGVGPYFAFGDGGETSRFLYATVFRGTAAERTQTQVKTLMSTLGWSPAWS